MGEEGREVVEGQLKLGGGEEEDFAPAVGEQGELVGGGQADEGGYALGPADAHEEEARRCFAEGLGSALWVVVVVGVVGTGLVEFGGVLGRGRKERRHGGRGGGQRWVAAKFRRGKKKRQLTNVLIDEQSS